MWAKKLRVLVNKMVGSSHGIIALRVVRSKLRKREETNNNSLGHGPALTPSRTIPAHQLPQLQQLQQLQADSTKVSYCQSATFLDATAVVTPATAVPAVNASAATTPAPSSDSSGTDSSADAEDADEPDEVGGKVAPLDLFLWSYPNEQLSPFSGSKDTLVRELPCEVPQDSKGLRKNLRGKWKRLVKKKPEDSCSIPPELRDQLKQIYVY